MTLTEKELFILQDTDFLLTKAKAIEKIYKLFEKTRKELVHSVKELNFTFPAGTKLATGKISRGENYRNLPYLVLDYPALFTRESVFAYRTMFWWGNFFSATLHLEGSALNNYRNSIINNFETLLNRNIYIGVGKTPWQYHYGKDNYIPLTKDHKDFISKCKFLKLSKKIEIIEWDRVPGFSKDFFKFILLVFNN